MIVEDINHNVIDNSNYITFACLKNRLTTKMRKFVLIYGVKHMMNNNIYFKYTDILIYSLHNFFNFIDLLESNDISSSIAYRINKSKNHFGKPSSKNIVFSIFPSKLNKLFDKLN